MASEKTQKLLSVPPNLVKHFFDVEKDRKQPEWFISHDPVNCKLGSGGGTAYLLREAWLQTGNRMSFDSWLDVQPKIIIHGGGYSRRLPAYAFCGKLLTPIPVFRWKRGQKLNQTLLDLQLPLLNSLLETDSGHYRGLIASGDALTYFQSPVKTLPEVDVLCVGLWSKPEDACKHGVFFCRRQLPEKLEFFLQKPIQDQIRKYAVDYIFMIDVGIWLLSQKAINVLMKKCGLFPLKKKSGKCYPDFYDLYGSFGPALGANPQQSDKDISTLSSAVITIPDGKFYHFGQNRDLLRSCLSLQNLVTDQRRIYNTYIKPRSNIFIQNAMTDIKLSEKNHTLWIENSHISFDWKIHHSHLITGVPENNWSINLPPQICLDIVPVHKSGYCIRPYGIDDNFKGRLSESETTWLNRPLLDWFKTRKIKLKDAGLSSSIDIQQAKIFPVFKKTALDERFIKWMLEESPAYSRSNVDTWLKGKRLSATEISNQTDLPRLYSQRKTFQHQNLPTIAANYKRSIFYQLDLKDTAEIYAGSQNPLPEKLPTDTNILTQIHDQMFRATVRKIRGESWKKYEKNAYRLLATSVIDSSFSNTLLPQSDIFKDQIIWGRSPVRLDIAGGWTDTPPYCIIHGGRVINLAANLNGQPPIQVFAKTTDRPCIIIRSIDLGKEIRVMNYSDLENYNRVGDAFSIPKAALCLVGFSPKFQKNKKYSSLKKQLFEFGGGIELSLLAAVPKGSGLGTSSILGATLIGTLSELCSLHWDNFQISHKTLVLEQMLTTGGGWQDQLGGILRGIKMLETQPGIDQTPQVKWLPEHLFKDVSCQQNMLLYYTGVTRTAKDVLAEIVRGMFLNSSKHLDILEQLYYHAEATYEVFQKGNWDEVARMVDKSWTYNKLLDEGTNTPEIQKIIDLIDDYTLGLKLLGAGGGGYMLILSKDNQATRKIIEVLNNNPPNENARFVHFELSDTGMEITRS